MRATSLFLCAFLILFVVQPAQSAKPPGGHLNITQAYVSNPDSSTNFMIVGEDFLFGPNPPSVTLGDLGPLTIVGTPTDTLIEASYAMVIPDGDYLMTVFTGTGQSQKDEYDLTIGAIGPQGPKGDTGPAGADGVDGADGADGADGSDGADGADGANGLPGADGVDGAEGPEGPQGPQGEPGNIALAGLSCPTGEFLVGFDATGGLICMPLSPSELSAPVLTTAMVNTALEPLLFVPQENIPSLQADCIDLLSNSHPQLDSNLICGIFVNEVATSIEQLIPIAVAGLGEAGASPQLHLTASCAGPEWEDELASILVPNGLSSLDLGLDLSSVTSRLALQWFPAFLDSFLADINNILPSQFRQIVSSTGTFNTSILLPSGFEGQISATQTSGASTSNCSNDLDFSPPPPPPSGSALTFDFRTTSAYPEGAIEVLDETGTFSITVGGVQAMLTANDGVLNQTVSSFGINHSGSGDAASLIDGDAGIETLSIQFDAVVTVDAFDVSGMGAGDEGEWGIGGGATGSFTSTGAISVMEVLSPVGTTIEITYVAGNGFSLDSITVTP